MDSIVGKKIVSIRAMTKSELKREGWDDLCDGPQVAIVLEDGTVIYASQDCEGNGPGAIFLHKNGVSYSF